MPGLLTAAGGAADPSLAPSGGTMAAVEALQGLLRAVALAYRRCAPEALAEAARGCEALAGSIEGLDDEDPVELLLAALVLRSLQANPALSALRSWFVLPRGLAERVERAAQELAQAPPLPGLGTLPELFAAPRAAGGLPEQLRWAADRWAPLLDAPLVLQLLRAQDVLEEEHRPRGGGPGPGPGAGGGPGPAPWEGPGEEEAEGVRFSEDRDWMPSLVLVAKHTYVWLHQLSERFGRPVQRLDQIPEEALDELAERGFTGLWLIGLWERSPASAEIKRRCGNPEAEASAYALADYVLAERLGGEEGWRALRDRASARGLRLAADMVPNHVGIDGRWVVEHPDWFVQTEAPPYPGYRFTGPDLSADPSIEVRLEDGYWDRSDAAVVFERRDVATAEVRYLYHGNDGTQMPWNDTAQLDLLNPEVREALIGTILEVARRFPVIRFDAAMTLARRHVRRLWHPPPGQGGAIPSRAERAVSPAAFDAAMPREFWREVVERVAQEAPDTLLLAEAFWMMEGYFVRTLGMHRVYNSAFMHMLRDEDNAGFRRVVREVLAHSPAVLERFVNFVNNPDEETAAAQFGTGDKYFGVATLMATLPGLPMFGHGQVEGFTEKYGMEYGRPYQDERPDAGLVAHHQRVIAPLLFARRQFSRAEHFALLDLETEEGVGEQVIAFANRGPGGERSLVAFNNRWERSEGALRDGAPVNRAAPSDPPELVAASLGEALALEADSLYAAWDLHRERFWVLDGGDLLRDGLMLDLRGYEVLVLTEWRALDPSRYGALRGSRVADLEAALLVAG